MSSRINRRSFLKHTIAASAAGTLALGASASKLLAADAPPSVVPKDMLPMGKIGNLQVSRMLLGGNLLTHYTHSRDLKYVYALTAHYNTEEKIMETLARAEQHGINTVSMHNPPGPMSILRKYRQQGGKIQWIICPTAEIEPSMAAFSKHVQDLIQDGCDAIYIWGVRSDQLIAQGKVDLIAKAVETAKLHNVPVGVGAHDLRVVVECEKAKVPCDFYIKTFHHHNYPSGPKPEQIKGPYNEHPGYWCSDPKAVTDFMKTVEKPWLAFKVMAAGAIPPENAFRYAFENGADHILTGMFDFEIAEDVKILKGILGNVNRTRPWRS